MMNTQTFLFSKSRRAEIMTTFKINLTTEEAAQIVAALGFVRRNLAVNTKTMKWTFVPGQVIEYDLAAIINLEDIISRFNESIEESIESSPFHPYVVDF